MMTFAYELRDYGFIRLIIVRQQGVGSRTGAATTQGYTLRKM